MEEADRRRLRRSRVRLVKELRLEPLWAPLLRRGLFTADMLEEIQSAGSRPDQARQLLCDVETRGRRALADFVLCLRDTGQERLAELLSDGHRPEGEDLGAHRPPPEAHRRPPPPPPAMETPCEAQPGRPGPLEEKPQRDSDMVYPLTSEPCGYCLIINNVNFDKDTDLKRRLGSNVDCQRLEKRFRVLHFEILTKEDLTAQSYHNQIPGAIFGTDGQRIALQKVVSYFNGSHCPSLRGKPKLFFIQACGGEEKDPGFKMESDASQGRLEEKTMESDATPMRGPGGDHDELDATATLPTDSDILVCYPTFPGHVSWRDTQSGSWLIETLDQVLAEYAHQEDLSSILMKVANIVADKDAGPYKQMPGHVNFFRKKFFFKV